MMDDVKDFNLATPITSTSSPYLAPEVIERAKGHHDFTRGEIIKWIPVGFIIIFTILTAIASAYYLYFLIDKKDIATICSLLEKALYIIFGIILKEGLKKYI